MYLAFSFKIFLEKEQVISVYNKFYVFLSVRKVIIIPRGSGKETLKVFNFLTAQQLYCGCLVAFGLTLNAKGTYRNSKKYLLS